MSFKSPYRMFSSWRAPRESALGFFPLTYVQRVVATGPIAYWIQDEGAGLVAIDQINSPLQDGTYTGITWPGVPVAGPDGNPPVPFYDGGNDFTDIFTPVFNGVFDGQEGSLMVWAMVNAVGDWTDGSNRTDVILLVDAANFILVRKLDPSQIEWIYSSGGALLNRIRGPVADVGWMNLTMTWSLAAGQFRAYFNGIQEGLTQAVVAPWVGPLDVVRTLIGANSQVPATVWSGYLAHCAVWDFVLTPAQVLALGTV